ncbi:hypothetical protein EDB85DRAFT_2221093 [Lactarius pseudohatsudake]|nr:hypothetical protein EDB85DRAFT_2221093 [Lactarius pseudohatsudake]
MPRINADPNQEVCPSFESDGWDFLRQSMIDAHQGHNPITGDEAVQLMKEAWARENALKIVAWNAQLEQDRAAQDEQERLDQEIEAAQLAQREKEAEDQRKEAEKKKPKMNTFDPRRCLGDWIEPRPAQYALNKINNLEWVELDYFTLKGCRDATADSSKSNSQDTIAFTQLGSTIAMRPLAAMTPSRGIRNDEDLSWLELLEAKNSMLHFIAKSGTWPAENAEALAAFFVVLDVHPIRVQTNGRKALLLYQSRVRREWFDALGRNEGFNIEIISEGLLRTISDDLNTRIQEGRIEKVRTGPLFLQNWLALTFFPLFPFSLDSYPPLSSQIPNKTYRLAAPTVHP